MDGYGRAGGGILSMIGPGIGDGFVGNLGRFEGDRWIAGAIHALRALLANAETPVRIVAKGKDENGVVGRLRGGGTGGELFCGRRILAQCECSQDSTEQ